MPHTTSAPELLAPAGSAAMLRAAIRCGADAVYLGGGGFNARASASNFSLAQLEAAIKECRRQHVKAYLTLNTLVTDRELPEALALAESAVAFGADAVIVQDLGLLRLLHERWPALALHASTQCSVQTAAGMALLTPFGVTRAVVPRECTAEELERLLKDAPVDLEVFVHGALCMSVSGQCRMSAALGGGERSANRGSCAQPCRLPVGCAASKIDYALSLKDLSLLAECARPPLNRVASFKIEGRQKRPEYAAAAVTAFRCAMDGVPSPVSAEDLRQAFARSGFTQGYFRGERGAAMFGTRRPEDVAPPELLRRLAALYAEERPRVPLAMEFVGELGKPARLRVRAPWGEAVAEGGILQPARQAPLTEDGLRRQLGKLGGTPYYMDAIEIALPGGAFLPMGQVAALRRQALEALAVCDDVAAGGRVPPPHSASPVGAALCRPPQRINNHSMPALYIRVHSHRQLPAELPGVAKLLLPVDTPPEIITRWRAKLPVAVTIPAGIFGAGASILEQLRRAAACGVTEAMAQTPDGVALALEAGLVPLAGEGMNLCNGAAMRTAAMLGAAEAVVSPECAALPERPQPSENGPAMGILAYGRLSLMLLRNCPVKAFGGCGARLRVPAACQLADRKGVKFPLRCQNGCAELFNSRPLWLADKLERLRRMPLDFLLLSFTVETPEACAAAVRAYREGGAPPAAFTRGALRV